VLAPSQVEPRFLEWLFAAAPKSNAAFAKRWREGLRLSAQQLLERADVRRIHARRAQLRQECLAPMMRNHRWSVFFHLDLETTAGEFGAAKNELPELQFAESDGPMTAVRDAMFRAAV